MIFACPSRRTFQPASIGARRVGPTIAVLVLGAAVAAVLVRGNIRQLGDVSAPEVRLVGLGALCNSPVSGR